MRPSIRDTSGQARNRIKVIKNYIKPVIEQYRGNALIMDITIKAEATSYKAINRREENFSKYRKNISRFGRAYSTCEFNGNKSRPGIPQKY